MKRVVYNRFLRSSGDKVRSVAQIAVRRVNGQTGQHCAQQPCDNASSRCDRTIHVPNDKPPRAGSPAALLRGARPWLRRCRFPLSKRGQVRCRVLSLDLDAHRPCNTTDNPCPTIRKLAQAPPRMQAAWRRLVCATRIRNHAAAQHIGLGHSPAFSSPCRSGVFRNLTTMAWRLP
jgi:hypothetical protein